MLRLAAATSLLIALATAGCAAREATLPPDQAHAALEFVVQKVYSIQPDTRNGFSAETEAALVAARRAVGRSRTDGDLLAVLNTFLASLHDGHVEVRLTDAALAKDSCVELPLDWRPEGLVFTRDAPQFDRGSRLVRLGGLDEAALLQRFRSMTPAENEGRLKFLAAKRLRQGTYLRAIGVGVADSHVVAVIESRAGKRTRRRIPLAGCPGQQDRAPWVGFDIHEDASLGVFWFRRFEYNADMADAMERFFRAVNDRNLQNIAVDLRGNEGGDSTVAFAFLQHLANVDYESFSVEVRISDELTAATPAFGRAAMSAVFQSAGLPPIAVDAGYYLLPGDLVKYGLLAQLGAGAVSEMTRVSGRRIYMLTDAGTFSSGNLFAILLRDNRLGTLVGEPTGNKVNFNGSELRLPVPCTGLYLNVSSAKMLRPDPSRGDAASIVPDVAVVTTRDDIAAGRDPQLQYLLVQSAR